MDAHVFKRINAKYEVETFTTLKLYQSIDGINKFVRSNQNHLLNFEDAVEVVHFYQHIIRNESSNDCIMKNEQNKKKKYILLRIIFEKRKIELLLFFYSSSYECHLYLMVKIPDE